MAVNHLIAQAVTALPDTANSPLQLEKLFDQGLSGVGAVFVLAAIAITVIATFAVRLDYILSFWNKYFRKADVALSKQTLLALRRNLLQQMKADVDQRLHDSLHNLVRVDLEQEEQRHQVGQRRQVSLVEATPKSAQATHRLVQRELTVSNTHEQREAIPPAEQTYQVFHRPDIDKRLLILGEPGGGKTTELLTIAQRLVEDAIEDDTQPIPLIFEMSSWMPNLPLFTWLEQQLQNSYGVSKKLTKPLAQQWIQQAQILPLLDGLDELGQSNQINCIKALEDFLALYPALPALVFCRREEYEQAGEQMTQLNGAIYLQAVGPQQIRQYLKDLGQEQLWETLQTKPELFKLAQSPLFLAMLVVASQDQPIQDTASLFNAYIHKQLHEPSHQGTYKPGKEKSPEQTLHYLGWLARQLQKRNSTEFLIEYLRPDWLRERQPVHGYRLRVLFFTWLICCLSSGLLVAIVMSLKGEISIEDIGDVLFVSSISALLGGTLLTCALGIILLEDWEEIKIRDQMQWVPKKAGLGALLVVLFNVLSGILFRTQPFMLIDVLFMALLGALWFGFSNKNVQQEKKPNQGIRKSLRNGLIVGLLYGLLFGLFGWWNGKLDASLPDWVAIVLLFGVGSAMRSGLMAGIKHFSLRIRLTKNGDAPWNYAKFLNHAARHRFIQRTGGRYRFIHDLLRQHFAQMTPQQQVLLAQKNRH